MSLKQYIIIMLIATLLCWGMFALVLLMINPFKAGILGFLFFYLSLFCATLGTGALIGLGIRQFRESEEIVYKQVLISFRQGIFFAGLICGLLFLQSFRLLAWWNISLLIFALALLELFFLTYRREGG